MAKPKAQQWMPRLRPTGSGAVPPTGHAFRTEWIDFDRGIRVGNLEQHERITQILKFNLEQRHQQPFTLDRWGRGEFWQWICWLPKANREAKPLSSHVNFGCAKFFISVDRDGRVFQSGMQTERAPVRARGDYPGQTVKSDWDWHVLVRNLRKGGPLEREMRRLVCDDDFIIRVGAFEELETIDASSFRGAAAVRKACEGFSKTEWGGLQLFYPMPEKELGATDGPDLVEAILAVFDELVPAMNLCMGLPCLKQPRRPEGLLHHEDTKVTKKI